ncbi:MAG TPA: hypothetical protein VHG70_07580 [Nocardioidaceae bacterium]|nr:hypothetical protein [Nocardioidaceae bacterium]
MHIGSGKTGTSSLQAFLRDNRERLAELGHLYPTTPGPARHGRLGFFVKSDSELVKSPGWYREKQSDPARFRKAFRRRLFSEIESSGLSRVLFSDEILFHLSDPALRRLGRFMNRIAENLRLVAYLRRQDDHMVSRYQQGVKVGLSVRLAEHAQQDKSRLYDYHARLRRHERLLRPAEFVVRRYERDSFVDGSLYQDFLDAAGIDARADEWHQVKLQNESLDAESVEFLRLLNLYRIQHEGAKPGLIYNRRLVRRLARASTGPTLTLPDSFLDEFMARWDEGNRRVAQEFMGDASGRLFLMPRKTRNTTAEQFLDPARLDHFLALTDLPEQLHAPLRALVEREARAR